MSENVFAGWTNDQLKTWLACNSYSVYASQAKDLLALRQAVAFGSGVAYAGGPLIDENFKYPVVIDLAGLYHDSLVPLYIEHNQQIGTCQAKWCTDGMLHFDANLDMVCNLKKASVNVQAIDHEISEKPQFVNGRWQIPRFILFKKSRLKEISLVEFPGDELSYFRLE